MGVQFQLNILICSMQLLRMAIGIEYETGRVVLSGFGVLGRLQDCLQLWRCMLGTRSRGGLNG